MPDLRHEPNRVRTGVVAAFALGLAVTVAAVTVATTAVTAVAPALTAFSAKPPL